MVSLKFHDKTDDTVLIVKYINESKSIYIHIECEPADENWSIYLDKSTAIKFSKELRKQIALLD